MSFYIIPNTAWQQVAEIRQCNSSNVNQEAENLINVTGGARYLGFEIGSTSERRHVYMSKGETFPYDTVVLTNADAFNSQAVKIVDYSAYTSGSSDRLSTGSFAESLYGRSSDIYVLKESSTRNADAVEFRITASATTKKINKFFVSNSIELIELSTYRRVPLARGSRVSREAQHYDVDELLTLTFSHVADSDFLELINQYKLESEPFFFYDSDGSWFTERVFPCLLSSLPISKEYDGLQTITINLYLLKEY